MKKKILTLSIVTILTASCTDEKGARRAIENEGMHPIEVGGYDVFACSNDDHYATKFKAYSADSSKIVTGCVCAGLLKGSTIRFD
jgi:hypothetical protein